MKLRWGLLAIAAFACALRCTCRHAPREPVRIATFNIEDFPKNRKQIDGAFAEIRTTHASIVGVQEIGSAGLLAHEARWRLGDTWELVHVDTGPDGDGIRRNLGVLYDSARWKLLGKRVFNGTRLGSNHKPVLDVRLQDGSLIVHVLVVHFKAATDGRPVRAAQYRALREIVREVQRSQEKVVLLGDFNATEPADRDDLATLARDTSLVWASEPLACTAFWRREDGCPRSRLDQVLTSSSPAKIEVAGACAREGCDATPSCPLYAREVSDHCPVVVTFP